MISNLMAVLISYRLALAAPHALAKRRTVPAQQVKCMPWPLPSEQRVLSLKAEPPKMQAIKDNASLMRVQKSE